MRFLTLDYVYPDAWNALPHSTPEEWFHQSFGTSDFMDIALRAAGHEAETIVVNGDPHWQVKVAEFKPTHIISQNVGMWGAYEGSPLAEHRRFHGCKLIGFCSYAANDQTLTGWDVLFSSFTWMPEYCRKLGQYCEYLPLAFGKPVLRRLGEDPIYRDIPVAFVGGLGDRIWKHGTATMLLIASAVPEFKWWGYKVGELPPSLERSYQGPAWGLDYYRLLHRIMILVNRHGEISRGSGNNMRQWESVGCGCYLLTDEIGEIGEGTIYADSNGAVYAINDLLERWDRITAENAKCGQRWVLEHGCYENRVPRFLEVIESLE